MRLIDADSLKNKILSHAPIIVGDFYKILNFIDEAPTVERPHGEWIKKTEGLPHLVTIVWYVCSECGVQKSEETPFCPWCGASMMKEGEQK